MKVLGWLGWVWLLGTTLLIAVKAASYLSPDFSHGFLSDKEPSWNSYAYPFYAHIFGATVAMFLGFGQAWPWLRAKWPRWHAVAGKAYAALVLGLAAPAGLWMAGYAHGGIAGQMAFFTLACLWWGSTYLGWRAAKQHVWPAHQNWMLLSFALALAAPLLRLYHFLWVVLAPANALPSQHAMAYACIAWACWLPQLLGWLLYGGVSGKKNGR